MSSSRLAVAIVLLVGASASAQQARPFAVERLYPSPPGGGWFALDALDTHGGLGGALAATSGFQRDPLRVRDDTQRLAVVSDLASLDLGAAVTYRRFRFYASLAVPIVMSGQSGTVAGYSFLAPSVDLGTNPDSVSDVRFGVDVRIVGWHRGPFRLGAGLEVFAPSGNAGEYQTDGTWRAMMRVLCAGDARYFTYAAHLGTHVRALNEPSPGGPQGTELLFAAAAGTRLPFQERWAVVLGPELYGATAFRSFFGVQTTAVEAMLSARIEGTRDDAAQIRVKLGAGGGLDQHFGAAAWRLLIGVELFGQRSRSP
jgi:hypothetical protein